MPFPVDVTALLESFMAGIQNCLPHNLVGVYLRGSLAMGDFIPETSDLDVLAVTERPVNDTEFAALLAMHAQITALPNPYANRLEMAYIDQSAFRRFQPGLRHPTLGQGEKLAWSEHHENWILERWVVRQYGIALLGPEAHTLVDPVLPEEIRNAVRLRLADWVDWANSPDDPDWKLPRSHKAYAVETMCRALYTLATGELASKAESVAWALRALPEPWQSIVERSQAWRTDSTYDPSIASEVSQLILWTASHA